MNAFLHLIIASIKTWARLGWIFSKLWEAKARHSCSYHIITVADEQTKLCHFPNNNITIITSILCNMQVMWPTTSNDPLTNTFSLLTCKPHLFTYLTSCQLATWISNFYYSSGVTVMIYYVPHTQADQVWDASGEWGFLNLSCGRCKNVFAEG